MDAPKEPETKGKKKAQNQTQKETTGKKRGKKPDITQAKPIDLTSAKIN